MAELPQGAVVLPDLDLSMGDAVWDELGGAGDPAAETPFGRGDAVTHPQYHLKLLLNRMGVARGEVQPWHRAGLAKGPPERSHAISSLFLPPEASKAWVDLPAGQAADGGGAAGRDAPIPRKRRRPMALLVREALEVPEKRVAVVTPDRGLAGRVAQHLRRWNVMADDSAGKPLPQTAAGRVLLLLAEVAAEHAAPVPLVALLEHPLVMAGERRADWLDAARAFELELRGPRKEPGLAPLRPVAAEGAGGGLVRRGRGTARPAAGARHNAQSGRLAGPARRRWRGAVRRGPVGARGRAGAGAPSSRNCGCTRATCRLRSNPLTCPPRCAMRWTGWRCARPMAAIRAWRSMACSKRG